MFEGPWGGILGLIVFAIISLIIVLLERDPVKPLSEEEFEERYGKDKKRKKSKKRHNY